MEFPLIQRPNKKSEFEFQAELFFALKKKGFEVYGEVPAKFNHRKSCFDLVVFYGNDAAVIIEVKNSPNKAILYGKKTGQSEKYREYGIPVVFHTTATTIEETIKKVQLAIGAL